MDREIEIDIEEIVVATVNEFLIPKFMELGMNATGNWIDELTVSGNELWGADYSYYLIHGRRPGAMPPIAAIEKWVRAKFGLTGREATSMAWAVATKIKNEGTSWYQQGGSDLLEVLQSQETIDFMSEKAGERLKAKVQDELIRELKETFP